MPFGVQNRFGFRRPQEDLFEGQDPEMIPPWEREDHPIRTFSPEESEQPDPQLVDSLVRNFTTQDPVSAPYGGAGDEIETPVFDRYLEEIQNAPRREDYEVGTGRKILAGLAGAAAGFTGGAERGARTIQNITEGPYQQAQKDFQDRIEPLEKGVGYEKSFSETLRKKQNDQRNYGAKIADLEAKRDRTKGQLEISLKNSQTAEERAYYQNLLTQAQTAYTQEKAEIDHINAGARKVAADASMVRAQKPHGTGSPAKTRYIDPRKQMEAKAFVAEDAFNKTLDDMPSLKQAGTITFNKGKVVFPKGLDPRIQEKFLEIHRAKIDELADLSLKKTY